MPRYLFPSTLWLAACFLVSAAVPSAQAQQPPGSEKAAERPDADSRSLPEEVDEDQSYMPVVVPPFEETYQQDVAQRDEVVATQKKLLEQRYDLSDQPSDLWMSGKRRKVQQGGRVKLPEQASWEELSEMTPAQIRQQ